MFEHEALLTAEEYDSYVIACLDDAVLAPRRMARDEASRARALTAFARSRPAGIFDRAPGERGAASTTSVAARPAALTDVSEWAVDEAAATLGISGRAASLLLLDAVTLVEGLPATLAALSVGGISPAHARVRVEVAGSAAVSGRGLGPPGSTEADRRTVPLDRFVQLRDRRCRFPGCRVRARCCDLDHQVPHPAGSTAHDTLACLCEHHHRLSHQAPGWLLHRSAGGGLVRTPPSGRRITTYPPAFGGADGDIRVEEPRQGSGRQRSGRQRYDDALATIRSARPTLRSADAPF